jgi:glycosyltransferase involved in cell wall biosynthesis
LLVEIVRHLPPEDFESVVCCIQERGDLAPEVESAGIPVICLNRMRSKRFDWSAVAELVALIRRERIALVHTHLYHANLYGRLAALRADVPVIATVHNTYTRTKLHRRLLNRALAKVTARVVAVSDDIRQDLLRHDGIPEDKIATIHNGIDLSRVHSTLSRTQARERLGLPEDVFVLGCVARLEEQKGHIYLLQALALLIREAPFMAARLRVLLVGEGRLRGALEKEAAALRLDAMVSFLGTRRDVADILRALDGYVMPSLWEGLSLALLEAMASGLPVIASDVGGVSQVLAGATYAIRVPAREHEALATAIRSLFEEPSERRAKRGAEARQRVRAEFSVQSMVSKVSTLYRETVHS